MAGLPMTQRSYEDDSESTGLRGDPRVRPQIGGRFLGMQQGGGGSGGSRGSAFEVPSLRAGGSQLRGARGGGQAVAERQQTLPTPSPYIFPRQSPSNERDATFPFTPAPQTYNFHAQQSGGGRGGLPDWYRGGGKPQSLVGPPAGTGGGRVGGGYFTRPRQEQQGGGGGGGRVGGGYFTRPRQGSGEGFHQQQRLPDYFTRPRQGVLPRVKPLPIYPQAPFIGMRPVQPRVGAKPLPILPYLPRQHIETRDIIPMLPVEPNVKMLLQQGYLRLPKVGGTMGRFGVRPPSEGRFMGARPDSLKPPTIGRRKGESDSSTVKAGGVVVILTDRSGKVLMLQRGQEQEWMGGAFDLPAMKASPAARARPYAVQAVQTETGLVMGEENLRCLFTAYHPEAGEVAFFHGVVEPGLENGIIVNPPEHVGYMWVDLSRDNEIEGVPYMDLVTYVMSEEGMLGVSNYSGDEEKGSGAVTFGVGLLVAFLLPLALL